MRGAAPRLALSPQCLVPLPCHGAAQVKAFKPTTVQLFQPLAEALVGGAAAAAAAAGDEAAGEALHESLMAVYEWPDKPRHLGACPRARSRAPGGLT